MAAIDADVDPSEKLASLMVEIGISLSNVPLRTVSTCVDELANAPQACEGLHAFILQDEEFLQSLASDESLRILELIANFIARYAVVCVKQANNDEDQVLTTSLPTDLDEPIDTGDLHAPILRGRYTYLSPSYSHPGSLLSPVSANETSSEQTSSRADQPDSNGNAKSRFAEYFEQSRTMWKDIQNELAPIYNGVSPTSSHYPPDDETVTEARQRERTVSQQLQSFRFDSERQMNSKYSRLKRLWVPALNLDLQVRSDTGPWRPQRLDMLTSGDATAQVVEHYAMATPATENIGSDHEPQSTQRDEHRQGDSNVSRSVGRRRRSKRRRNTSTASETSNASRQ